MKGKSDLVFILSEGVMVLTATFRLVASAVLVAFGVLLPMAFHLVGALGPVFLPMHIPVLAAGLLLGPASGLAVGLAAPLASSLLTGMPPLFPVLPVMACELAMYGLAAGYLYRRRGLPLLAALVAAMVCGRAAAGLAAWGLAALFAVKLKPLYFVTGAVVTGLPGIAVQLVVVPLLVGRLQGIFDTMRQRMDKHE